MLRTLDRRLGHYLLLASVWAACSLPNLGGPTLWDIDEGLNSEASREMLASGNYIVPTFNYQLRTAKPALLYWAQAGCYRLLGVNETAARLPSALAALLTILATYELGRWLYGSPSALLAGILLTTCIGVQGAAHFANPDALLLATTTATLALWYRFHLTSRALWLHAAGAMCGLAVLAKGPVGLALPGAVIFLFLLWQRQLGRLIDLRLVEAFGFFLLVAAPWYIWVGVETKGVFLLEFWNNEHLRRSTSALEAHSGWPGYYLCMLFLGLAPWSVFLVPATIRAVQTMRPTNEESAASRFLGVWILTYLLFFSFVGTKLPNYILPVYPAAALLVARALVRWREGEDAIYPWAMRLALITLAVIGTGTGVGLLLVGGMFGHLPTTAQVPGLASWAWVGGGLVVGAVVAWRYLSLRRRDAVVVTLSVAAVAFLAPTTGGVLARFNLQKASQGLAEALPEDHLYREVRLASWSYDRPSLIFYCKREVQPVHDDRHAVRFLTDSLPVYLFVPEDRWGELKDRVPAGVHVLASRTDLYRNGATVLVVANAAALATKREVATVK